VEQPSAALGAPRTGTGAGAGEVLNKEEGSVSFVEMIQNAERLQNQNNTKKQLQSQTQSHTVPESLSVLQKEDGAFSLEQMIQDAERLQAQKNVWDARAAFGTSGAGAGAGAANNSIRSDSQRSGLSDGASTAVTSTGMDDDNDNDNDHDNDETSYNNYDEENGGDGGDGGADSDLDLDGYNPADEKGSQLSLSQQDGRLSGSGSAALFGSGSGATSRDQSASADMDKGRAMQSCTGNPAETDRIEYTPKVSSTDPQRRQRPDRPTNKPAGGAAVIGAEVGARDSYSSVRSSDCTASLHASNASVATLPAGSHIELADQDYNIGYYSNYNGDIFHGNGHGGRGRGGSGGGGEGGGNTIGIGFVQHANASGASTPEMVHGEQKKIFPYESAPALFSQQYPAAYNSSCEQAGAEAPHMYIRSSNDSSSYGSSSYSYSINGGGDRLFMGGPHPSAEPNDLGSHHTRHKLPVALSASLQSDSGSVYGHGSHSEEYTASISANVSRGGSVEGRPSDATPGMRLSGSGSVSRISPGVSPGASLESFERAGSGGGAAIRRQALQELNNSMEGAAGRGGGVGLIVSLPDPYNSGIGSQGQWQQQLQQGRITKKALRSKSANAAGPAAIPFNLAGSRLPPMAAISSASSGYDGVGSEHTTAGGKSTKSMSLSGSSAGIGLGQGRGIAQGMQGLNPVVPLGGPGKITNLSGTMGAGGLGSIGMPVDYTSRGIHSAPSVSRTENFALPPIQATMTPTNKTKVATPKTYLSNSSEGAHHNYR